MRFSVYIRHDDRQAHGATLHSVFGHIQPGKLICAGLRVDAGKVIGSLEIPVKKDGSVPLHLHLTLAWVRDTIPPERLSWDLLGDPRLATLMDPKGAPGYEGTSLYWYSPEVKYFVKCQYGSYGESLFAEIVSWELTDFKVKK
ncbi:MAG: hypothetical protein JRJ85_14245 [Deltaproteobacteria bacterium]|nr:hypothetical protein [Deltaproteobacteria bacterium]